MTAASPLRPIPSVPAVVGYVRAAAGQSPIPQINALMRAGVAEEDIYIERTSGHKTAWPERDLLLPQLSSGDTITITRLDRLFYSVQNLILVGTDLRDRGIHLHAVEQNLDSRTPDGRDFFATMSHFAALHYEFVLAASNDSRSAARGKVGGRPPLLTPEQAELAQQLYDSGTPVSKIARTFNAAPATIYRYITPKPPR